MKTIIAIAIAATPLLSSESDSAQAAPLVPRLQGAYHLVDNPSKLPRGMRPIGDLAHLPLTEKAKQLAGQAKLPDDSAKLCLPVGPFRMMAWKDNVIDLYQLPDRIVVLFQDIDLGYRRALATDGKYHGPTSPEGFWEGESAGRWEHGVFVVETRNLNQYVWLNDAGAPHSAELVLTERYKLLADGNYLEVAMTATDPQMLTKPYTYVRYYEKTDAEVEQHFCAEDIKTLEH